MTYTAETLRALERQVDDLYKTFLCDVDESEATAESEQFFLLALNSLDAARRFLDLAAIKQDTPPRTFSRLKDIA
jgi:hypothetical protein